MFYCEWDSPTTDFVFLVSISVMMNSLDKERPVEAKVKAKPDLVMLATAMVVWSMVWGCLAGWTILMLARQSLNLPLPASAGWVLALTNGLVLAVATCGIWALAHWGRFGSRSQSQSQSNESDQITTLAAICRNFHDRSLLHSDQWQERKKQAEMWFDIYRHELEFLLAKHSPNPRETRLAIVRDMIRDKQEWYHRKFFEYIENIKGKFSRKGFLYPMVLDDLQELTRELYSLIEIVERAGFSGSVYNLDPIRQSRTHFERAVYQVSNGQGLVELELRQIVETLDQRLKTLRQDWVEMGYNPNSANGEGEFRANKDEQGDLPHEWGGEGELPHK